MNLPLIPQDKANHAIYGALVFAAVFALLHLADMPRIAPACAGFATAVVACAKEPADWLANRAARAAGLPPPHGVELADALATCAGGGLCWVLLAVQALP